MKKIGLIIVIIIVIATIAGVIYNKNYVDNYNFKLIGSDNITFNYSDIWKDPLYTIEGDQKVNVTSNINYGQIGQYEIIYSIKIGLFEKKLVRKVNIVDVTEPTGLTITIQGSNPYYLKKGKIYQEEGYTSYDNIDGNITDKVQVNNNINNNVPGTYEVRYQVTNSDGITKTATRKVIIYSMDFEGKIKTDEYAKTNEITLTINDNNYDHTLLPNGTTTTRKQIVYRVVDNKKYVFTIYDNYGNTFVYEANISNIDKEKPKGSCTLSLLDNGGEISVTASDNSGVLGYEYSYGNTKSAKITASKYNFNTMDEKASVTIYDSANNYTTINCNTVDKSTKIERSYTQKTYTYNGITKHYWFYQPKISKRDKVPLVMFFHGGWVQDGINSVNIIALPKNIYDGKDFPFYVIAPFLGDEEGFALELINYIAKNNNVDTSRIVLSGASRGSKPALSIAANNPHKFSGVVVLAGYEDTPSVNPSRLTTIPIWVFQGSYDSYALINNYVNQINGAGGHAQITSYPGGHSAPCDAFLRDDLKNWVLTNRAK